LGHALTADPFPTNEVVTWKGGFDPPIIRASPSDLTKHAIFSGTPQPSDNFYYLEKNKSNHYLQELLFSRKIKV
jgi:hypothetical protein